MEPTRKREQLEFIIDSCSMGKAVLGTVNKFLHHSVTHEPRVFDHYRVIIPIQLGAEKERRIFPEFLDAELMTRHPHKHLHQFYRQHREQTKIVETETSLGFKFAFGARAAAYVRTNPLLAQDVVAEAQTLARQYRPHLGHMPEPNLTDLYHFLHRMKKTYDAHQQRVAGNAPHVMAHHAGERTERALHSAEQVVLARTARQFFAEASATDRLLLQAMYSHRDVHREVFDSPGFKAYHFNMGERAIEEAMYGRNAESHPERVTVVVSEDMGARNSIQRLRSQTSNSVFLLSSWGLAKAAREMGFIRKLDQLIHPESIERVKLRQGHSDARRARGERFHMSQVTDPKIEAKWAHRLVEVMRDGIWSDRPSRVSRLLNERNAAATQRS